MDRVTSNLTKVVSRTVSNASKSITIEAANLAKFSDGACTCSLGETSVLVTAVSRQQRGQAGSGFVPLSVDYRLKAAASGRIPMTHLRRDVGVTEREILTSRIIDRSIRPGFRKGFNNDTQIICNLLAVDGHNDSDILAINGASASLAISDIPWSGPIGAVRMGIVGENTVVNPTRKELDNSRLNLVVTANSLGNVLMLDGSCREPILITDLSKAIKNGIKECQAIIESISKLQKMVGKQKRALDLSHLPTEDQKNLATSLSRMRIKNVLACHTYDKISRDEALSKVREDTIESMRQVYPEVDSSVLSECFNHVVRTTYREVLNETGLRCDGRKFDDIRPINCQIDLYKPLHGSALFQRGQTQVFCSATYDSPDAAYRTDALTLLTSGIKEKNFMLHYEFPPFATNEIGKVATMPSRREIGHGALAEKAIRPVVPEFSDMTVRLNCEVLESNGSSSMASVSAGSLSLMDAGVKVREHVAGIAMGLVSDLSERTLEVGDKPKESTSITEDQNQHILTDILGFEDYIGDMDFKIAGTRKAVTALQLDVKPITGLPPSLLYKAIQKAHSARSVIISKMEKVIKEPRAEKKKNHPVIKTIYIPPHKKSKFIGFGGSNIKKLTAQIGVRISPIDGVEGLDDNEIGETIGAVASDNFVIFAPNGDAMQEAEEFIKVLLEKRFREPELEYNAIYTATIQEIRPNGLMITLYPNMQPTLLPLHQLDIRTVSHPSALNFEIGQEIQVKYFGREPETGRMLLSRKALQMTAASRVRRTPIGG